MLEKFLLDLILLLQSTFWPLVSRVCWLIFFLSSCQVRAQGSPEEALSGPRALTKNLFGISSSSRIGLFIHSYLTILPGLANDPEVMAETTELFDALLKLELLDHYERMTTKKRMSSVSMQQWLVGAAFHLHVRIHQVSLKGMHVIPSTSHTVNLHVSFIFSLKSGREAKKINVAACWSPT